MAGVYSLAPKSSSGARYLIQQAGSFVVKLKIVLGYKFRGSVPTGDNLGCHGERCGRAIGATETEIAWCCCVIAREFVVVVLLRVGLLLARVDVVGCCGYHVSGCM